MWLMSKTNASHVVPQFYLRYFTTNPYAKKKKQRINALLKNEGKLLSNQLISSIAHMRKFYTTVEDTDDTYESKLAALETKASAEYNKLVSSENLLRCNVVTFLRFFALQAVRTGKTREDLRKQIKKEVLNEGYNKGNTDLQELAFPIVVMQKLRKVEGLFGRHGTYASDQEICEEIDATLKKYENIQQAVLEGKLSYLEQIGFYDDKETLKQLHLEFLEGWQYFYEMIAADKSVKWKLYKNRTKKPLITSDNPVILIPNVNKLGNLPVITGQRNFLPQKHVDMAQVFIYLPLTPMLGFFIIGKSLGDNFQEVLLGEDSVTDEQFVEWLNGMQFIQSDKMVFSNTPFNQSRSTDQVLEMLKGFMGVMNGIT